MERLTKDNPQGNHETLMNYAYAKNENVHLIYAGGEKDVDLCEYTAKCCKNKNCAVDAEAIMEGILMDCDCPIATMYWVAVQAAELRGRLKKYEDAGLEPPETTEEYRTVVIPAREEHMGMDYISVKLKWRCPVCGGPRGEIFKTHSYDGSRRLCCDGWENPCGHIDKYSDVRKEAEALKECERNE